MRGKQGWLWLLLPLILGMRDPFKAPESRCPNAALSQWRYAGFVMGPVPVGIVRDEQARWLRVRHGESLPTGGRVVVLNENELVIDTLGRCEPARWRWQRQGMTQNEDRDRRTATHHQPNAGSPSRSRDAGGR
ncbi:DUF2531 family protein [Enterobacteriaceae bacterium H4N4]|uniref:DUF2531 family protein n=1 Tax=Silvania confinis TaxID=2926470 RepID=A0A9J6QB94_9ENTR|nr:HofP DNA utilization family protein [Silvania confinis]MCU6667948.1 DUF2531 family protein [Silvania confinis]